jgi:hypothetical protein
MRLAAFTLASCVVACAPIDGPVVVEAVVPDRDADGFVALADVQLDTVVDLSRGRAQRFDVRGGLDINLTDFAQLATAQRSMVEHTRGDGGADVTPQMHFDGERYVADSYETLFYFTLLANFESAFSFADDVGVANRATSSAAEDHAIVGMFSSIVVSPLLPIPLLSSDNAAYAPPLDGWLALRTAFQAGVPFAMHRGVIAHEFAHRVFFHSTVSEIDGGFDVWRDAIVKTSPDRDELRAQMLLKGLDEGLADVFAITALQNKDAVIEAFVVADGAFAVEAARRDVDGAFARTATYDNLRDRSLAPAMLSGCNLDVDDFRGSFNFYCVGTVLAATLWQAAESDAAIMRSAIVPAVLVALPQVGAGLANGVAFDLDQFLEPFVQALPAGRRRETACEAIGARFASLIRSERVPSCL